MTQLALVDKGRAARMPAFLFECIQVRFGSWTFLRDLRPTSGGYMRNSAWFFEQRGRQYIAAVAWSTPRGEWTAEYGTESVKTMQKTCKTRREALNVLRAFLREVA